MKIKSAFSNGENIPTEYTCEGNNRQIPIEITELPSGTKTIALIMDDPDAPMGTWDHWIMWNMPPGKIEGTKGKNSWGKTGYGGPCPPSGTHRYYIKIYALDTKLELKEGSGKKELENAMKEHIIEKAELMGKYKKINP